MSDMNNPPVATLSQPNVATAPSSLPEAVTHNLERYFSNLEGERPSAIYDMVLNAVERPMLELVMKRAAGNQCRASEMLGINRNTLRKKLTNHGLL